MTRCYQCGTETVGILVYTTPQSRDLMPACPEHGGALTFTAFASDDA